jgi:hypothetical protein
MYLAEDGMPEFGYEPLFTKVRDSAQARQNQSGANIWNIWFDSTE